MVVPASAVGEDGDGRFVFLIQEGDDKTIVKKQAITIGDLTPQGFEVADRFRTRTEGSYSGFTNVTRWSRSKIELNEFSRVFN